jgi:transcriptional regulator with XRE-family HTH domain
VAFKRPRLAERRKALGHSQEDLAALLGVDRSTVIRWEGAETEPQPWHRRKLAAVLSMTADELAELLETVSDDLSSVSLDFSKSSDADSLTEGFSMYDLTSRRKILEQLALVSGSALIGPIRQWVSLLDVDQEEPRQLHDVAGLRDAVSVFRSWDASGASGLKRKAVVGQLNAVAENVRETGDIRSRNTLLPIMAELAQLAGWMAYDNGLLGTAQRYYLLALHACKETGSTALALGVKVIGDMAKLSRSVGRYEDSLHLAQSGLYALPRTANKHVRAELLALEASAYARLGSREASNAVRSAEASREVWHEATTTGPTPNWLYYLDESEVDCLAANTYTQLALHTDDRTRRGNYADQAEKHALRARRNRSEDYNRSRVLDEIRLATVRLSQGEPVEAVAVAATALNLAEPVHSSIVHRRLSEFHTELALRYGDEPAVAEFTDHLDTRT